MNFFRYVQLSRPSTASKFVPEIDGLRFIAIFLVILHHQHFILRHQIGAIETDHVLWMAYVQLAKAGGLGVPLFFVISGIVLGLPFARAKLAGGQEVSLRRYFVRRLRRLEPPYLINLAVLFALAVASGGLTTMLDRLPNLAASVLYLHNTIYNEWSMVNFVAWSLEVEAQFYLIAPVLAIFFTIRGYKTHLFVITSVALFMSVIYAFHLDGPFRYTHSILALGQYFLSGFMIAGLMATGKLRGTRPSAVYDVVAFFAFVTAICFDLGWPDPKLHAMGVLPLTIFFLSVFRGRVILAILRWRPVFTIGGMCYTIYLYHFWIIELPVRAFDINERAMGPLGVLVFDLVMMAFVFAASSVLFAMFERPFMNRRSTPESGH